MRGKAVEVVLSAEERAFLEAHVRKHKAPRSLSDRCRIILLCAEGLRSREVAERAGVHGHTVGKRRRRFAERRIEGLSGRVQVRPAPHRDGREGGRGGRADADHDAEGRDALAGPEHGREDGRVARDGAPDPVGVQPEAAPERDVQAVDGPAVRRQGAGHRGALHGPAGPRGRPVRGREAADPGPGPDAAGPADGAGRGRAENPRLRPPRHDDALRRARRRHRRGGRQALRPPSRHGVPGFLKEVEAAVPDGLDVHLAMDSHATHKTEKARKRLARRRHWHIHFTPTSASWLNLVERWFAEPTGKKLQRSAHRPVAELEADIMSFIDAHNENPRPCKRVKSADEILASVRRFCLKMSEPGASENV